MSDSIASNIMQIPDILIYRKTEPVMSIAYNDQSLMLRQCDSLNTSQNKPHIVLIK